MFNTLGTEQNLADAGLPEREESAAALRGVGRDGRSAREEPSTPTRSASSRATRPKAGSTASTSHGRGRREGRRPLPERRLRQGSAGWAQEGHRAVEGQGRRGRAVRGRRQRRPVAGREVEELGCEHLRRVRRRKFAIQAYVTPTSSGGSRSCRSTTSSRRPRTSCIASEGGTNKLVDGSVSIVFLKDPTDPKWRNDAGMKLYRQIMKRFAPGANRTTSTTSTAWPPPRTAVEALKAPGRT